MIAPYISAFIERTRIIIRVAMAAGSAMPKFSLNLSFIAQPWPLQAAIVVSEMKERLSPNIAPPITEPMQSGTLNPEAVATDTAIGVISVMVPTDVPIAVETKHATMKRTATAKRGGITDSMKYATLSALLRPTTPTNAPAASSARSTAEAPLPSPKDFATSRAICRRCTPP